MIVGRMSPRVSRARVDQGVFAHASNTIMRFRSSMICVRACVCADTGSFFLHVALLLHGTSGHVPPVTHPPPSIPVHPVTKPPTLDTPESAPLRPTLVTSASFFSRPPSRSPISFRRLSHRSLALIKTYLPSSLAHIHSHFTHMLFALARCQRTLQVRHINDI